MTVRIEQTLIKKKKDETQKQLRLETKERYLGIGRGREGRLWRGEIRMFKCMEVGSRLGWAPGSDLSR